MSEHVLSNVMTQSRTTRTADVRYKRMSLAELTTPADGRVCYVKRWWAVTEDGHVLFYKTHRSPQCNPDKRVLEYNPICGTSLQLIAVAYVPHRCDHD